MNHTALIVDRNIEFVELFSIALESVGFEITTAKNSVEALLHLQKHPTNILALDIDGLDNGGLEILYLVRSLPETTRMRIIVLTNDPLVKLKKDARLADLVLVKPVKFKQLLKLAPRLLYLCRSEVH